MDARGHIRLTVLLLLLLTSAAVLGSVDVVRGLDLEGGAFLVYEIDSGDERGESDERDEAQVADVVRRRLDALDVDADVDASVTPYSGGLRIAISGNEAEALPRVRAALARSRRLRLLAVDDAAGLPPQLPDGVAAEEETLFQVGRVPFLSGEREVLARIPPPPGREILVGKHEQRWRTWIVDPAGGVDGSQVVSAEVRPVESGRAVSVWLDDAGRDAFAALTGRQQGKRVAIVLDDEVTSAPVVMDRITGGNVLISLGADASATDAQELALALAGGALPASLHLASESVVAPATTKEQQAAAVLLLLLLLTVVVIAGAKRAGGGGAGAGAHAFFSFCAAPVAVVMALAIHAALGATVTLPAAIALGLSGVAAAGAGFAPPLRAAIALVVVEVGALLLFAVASGPPVGFALGLLCGMPAAAVAGVLGVGGARSRAAG